MQKTINLYAVLIRLIILYFIIKIFEHELNSRNKMQSMPKKLHNSQHSLQNECLQAQCVPELHQRPTNFRGEESTL